MKRLWIPSATVEILTREAEKMAPLETGGVLAGYITDENEDIVITDIVGPGPKAVHRRTSYSPDYKYHREEVGKIYDRSQGTTSFLGDWHTHPGSGLYLSERDKKALRNIANYPKNFINSPIMIVASEPILNEARNWQLKAWRIKLCEKRLFWKKWAYVPLEIVNY